MTSHNVFVIAECGINHNGNIDIATRLISMAKNCGCDAVKFQKRTVEKCYTQEFLDSPRESPWGKTQREQKNRLEFNREQYDVIDSYCKEEKIDWFASAWDIDSQIFLRKYNLKYNKIASKMLADKDLVDEIAFEDKPTFVSTGLNDTDLIDYAIGSIRDITLMHCVMKYPCPDEETNLSAIKGLGLYGLPVGYSCHNPSILAPALAVAYGAVAIEVHITVDRSMYGTDQPASFEAEGLRRIVRDCHRVGVML